MNEITQDATAVAFLSLGSNQGDRRDHLRTAVSELNGREHVEVIECAPVYETEAHTPNSNSPHPPFLNTVIQIETAHPPEELLRIAHEIERAEGRLRDDQRWAPRPLDIDLLAYGAEVRRKGSLKIPHPRLAGRRFVLRPWADIAPNFVVPPPFEQSVRALLRQCTDTADVRPTEIDLEASM